MAIVRDDVVSRVLRQLNDLRARQLPESAPTYERRGSHVVLVGITGPKYDFERAVKSVEITPRVGVKRSR